MSNKISLLYSVMSFGNFSQNVFGLAASIFLKKEVNLSSSSKIKGLFIMLTNIVIKNFSFPCSKKVHNTLSKLGEDNSRLM